MVTDYRGGVLQISRVILLLSRSPSLCMRFLAEIMGGAEMEAGDRSHEARPSSEVTASDVHFDF